MLQDVERKIRQIRELKSYSQEYMAEKLGISIRAYSKIESGETQLTISRLNEISQILNVTPHEVLGFDTTIIFNNSPNQQGGKYVAYNHTDIKQIQELYERLLAEKDRTIQQYERLLNNSTR